MPSEYATIQTALSATLPGDTVHVSSGAYHEFLAGPQHSYSLIGEHPPDSVAPELWTVLDPIPLPDSDTPSVFRTGGDTVFIQNFAFYNRPELRQQEWPTRTGGIRNQANLLVVENCRFDSVSAAIEKGFQIRVVNSSFNGCLWRSVWTDVDGQLEARQCRFDGNSGYAFILAYDGSIIDSCEFGCNPSGHFMGLFGSGIRVRACRFGPCDGNVSTFFVHAIEDVVIEECTFEGIEDVSIILEARTSCIATDVPPIIVRNNLFRNFSARTYAMNFWCGEGEGYIGIVEGNSFLEGDAAANSGAAINVSGSATLLDNIFENVGPESNPDVYAHSIASIGTLIARENQFVPPGIAAATSGPPFDARWNWWGDSSGPYNASENPEGLGSEVGWGVEFFPWLHSPIDTTIDTNEVAADEHDLLIPAKFELRAFPNPFNAATTLEIAVARAGDYEVVLYDVTGREAARVFSGRIETRALARVDANKLASGVYFARLCDAHVALTTVKLLILK